ncbi:nuclear transport factor 2 family protein [Lunatimonas salinarum]|uniref:nuclear transport factor 2 family protein n=1 Tax=Lunatimonas salinarum TaxID=1774590 RepID=UPI001AE06915|nr:nuclear transport factor 2 family protein [Lunatimonas salinarum]
MKNSVVARFVLFVTLFWGGSQHGLFAQQLSAENEVRDLLQGFFVAMKKKDSATIRQAFHVDAVMQTVVQDGTVASLGTNDVSEFLKRVGTSEVELDERLLAYSIQVDGLLAHAWTPYEFYVDGKFSHCGVNSFQLIRAAEGWQITHVIDTRRKEGCR